MAIHIVLLLFGIGGLYLGGEWLVGGASRLARSFGVSGLLVGLTVVAFGTSAPELVVNFQAALGGSADIALGNIIGSNIFNIGLILGVAALITPLMVHVRLLQVEIPVMTGISVLVLLAALDGRIGRIDAVMLLASFVLFMVLAVRLAMRERAELSEELHLDEAEAPRTRLVDRLKFIGLILLGMALLVVGARLTVDGASAIARLLGVSDLVIGLTVVAAGTSLPEFAASVVAAIRKDTDISIGNVVGSNVFNLAWVLGLNALIRPIEVDAASLSRDLPVMLGYTLLLLPFTRSLRLPRYEAALFVLGFGAYLFLLFTR